jgi:hypothetical protein
MATRLYPWGSAAHASVAALTPQGAWNQIGVFVGVALATTKSGSVINNPVAETNSNTAWDVLTHFAVSEQLDANHTFGGTLDLCLAALESNAAADFFYHIHAWVTQGSTHSVRGTLLTDYVESAGADEWPTTATGQQLAAPQSLSTVNALAGDRIVIEIGYRATNNVTTSRTGRVYIGGTSGTDLTDGDTDTSHPGWVEFSDTLTFKTISALVSQLAIEALVKRPRRGGSFGAIIG